MPATNVKARQPQPTDSYTEYTVTASRGGTLKVGDSFCICCDANWKPTGTPATYPDNVTVSPAKGIEYDLGLPGGVPSTTMSCGTCSSGNSYEVDTAKRALSIAVSAVIEVEGRFAVRLAELEIQEVGERDGLAERLLRLSEPRHEEG
jgi:hypothetical protein